MQQLIFLVKGSAAEPYEVTFVKAGSSLSAVCTCPAGRNGNFCKHRIALLDGDSTAVSSDNAADASTVVDWLRGTDVEEALLEVRAAEKASNAAKMALTASKKKLARAMNS